MFTGYLGTNPALVQVRVAGGVVTLAGEVETKSMIPVAIRMARSVNGVVAVDTGLRFAVDDTRRPPAAVPRAATERLPRRRRRVQEVMDGDGRAP